MSNKDFILFTVLLTWTSISAFAQQGGIAQQRRAINEAITIMDVYATRAVIDNDEEYDEFLDLFVNDSVLVYNDLLGVSLDKNMLVTKYADLLRTELHNKRAIIKNIRKEDVTYNDGFWYVKLSFDKSISYWDSCGIFISSTDFYDAKDYRLTATLRYEDNTRSCQIEKIEGTIDSPQKPLSLNYFAFKRTNNKRDNDLRYKGELLRFNNDYDQALLEGDYDLQNLMKNFSYSNSDMELRPQIDNRQVSMRYKMRRLRLRPYLAIGLGKAFTRDGDDALSDSKSTGTSFGLDLGVSILSKRSFSLGVFTGVGFSMSSMNLSYKNEDYCFLSNADVDGDNYYRHYQDLVLTQKIKLNELNIPLYLDFNVKLAKSLSLYVDLGARFDANISHSVNDTEGKAYVYGIYHDYGNLRLDEQWPFNGFGNQKFDNTDLLSTDLIDVNSFTVCGMGGFGLRYDFTKIPLSIEAGMNIVMGLTNLVETAKVVTIDSNTPVVFNTISGTESREHLRNLTEMLNSVKRQQMRISLGVIYKF